MEPVYLLGLPIALLLFLFLMRNRKTVVKNPHPFLKTALTQVLASSPYSGYVEYWLAVSKMETGNWTSELFKMYYNPWGMKMPKVRPTTATAQTPKGWAIYSNLYEASKDILLWMEYGKFPKHITSLESFINALKTKGYFEEPINKYLNLVNVWIPR